MAFVNIIISEENNLVLTREIGPTDGKDIVEIHRDFLKDSGLGKHLRVLVCLHGEQDPDLLPEHMVECVPVQEQIMTLRGTCRTAIMAPTPLTYGISRMYKSYVESAGHTFGIFSTLDECFDWLSMTEDERTEVRRNLPMPDLDLENVD